MEFVQPYSKNQKLIDNQNIKISNIYLISTLFIGAILGIILIQLPVSLVEKTDLVAHQITLQSSPVTHFKNPNDSSSSLRNISLYANEHPELDFEVEPEVVPIIPAFAVSHFYKPGDTLILHLLKTEYEQMIAQPIPQNKPFGIDKEELTVYQLETPGMVLFSLEDYHQYQKNSLSWINFAGWICIFIAIVCGIKLVPRIWK